MWCYISQPNSVVCEIRVDPKACGQECLEKVCGHLNIEYESDYFGLKYENNKGEELWLNLRNPLDRQVHFHGHAQYLRLALRVKFWVPPHILQQESTRHQFYLHARLDFKDNRLVAPDWNTVARLIGYIAQAEIGDLNESDLPHNIYDLATNLTITTTTTTSNLISDDSDDDNNNNNNNVDMMNDEKPNDLLQRIIFYHRKCAGMKSSSAEYWFLQEISEFVNFGEEYFNGKFLSCNNTILFGVGPHGITIYDDAADDDDNKDNNKMRKELISFTNITSATSHKKFFKLDYINIDNKEAQLNIKLDSNHMASSLYRAVTEKHAFYSCETVRSAVTSQFIRDLKGTIVSIFNEDSTLGKKYVFDIRRTCREVYDNVRRALYQKNVLETMTTKRDINGNPSGDNHQNSQSSGFRFLDAMTCKICMDNQINAVFVPCGHGVACTLCASKCERCPVCRADIKQVQKLYLNINIKEMVGGV